MQTQIIKILKDFVEDPELKENINSQTNIITDIGLDSLGMINLFLRLEDEFDVDLDFDSLDIDHFSSVENLALYLQKLENKV